MDTSKAPVSDEISDRKRQLLQAFPSSAGFYFTFHIVNSSMNNMKSQEKLRVYYDGLCKVCSKEIEHYKKQKGADRINFVDICGRQFDAVKEGVDPVLVHKEMHVRRLDGTYATRVEAFIEIWKTLPKYNFLAKIASLSAVSALLDLGYSGFTRIRPFLPRYASPADCKDSPYCESNITGLS